MSEIPDNSVNLIVTSPPYNIGIDYPGYDDDLEWTDYWSWIKRVLEQMYRVLADDGRLCINHYLSLGTAEQRVAPLMAINQIAMDIGFNHHAVAVWVDRTVAKRTAWGSWLSASAPYVNSPYEGVLILYKDQWKRKNKGTSTISKDEFCEAVSGIWNIPTSRCDNYPATFPIDLPLRCINLFTYKGDIVLDPFLGRGTTVKACIQSGRIGIGFELGTHDDIIDNYIGLNNRSLDEFGLNNRSLDKFGE